jgi:transcriptional regulator with XRE-family HTH domain
MAPTPRQMGRQIKRLRTAKGLSQYALAKQAGISREYLRTLEEGHSDPTIGMLQKLAKALGVNVGRLLE